MLNNLMGMAANASSSGAAVDDLIEFCHWFMLILFIGWTSFFCFVLWRFHRSRNPKANYKGARGKISNHLEFSVVLIEAVLLLGFAIPLWSRHVGEFPDPKTATVVHAVAQQFMWNFHYAGSDNTFGRRSPYLVTATNPLGLDPNDPATQDDLVSTGELHVPVNQAVIVQLTSKDVIHNFALPSMRAAQDTIPGSLIPLWFMPSKVGQYEIVCGQLCGPGHGLMKAMLYVDTPEDYAQWLKDAASLKAKPTLAPQGQAAPTPQNPPASGATPAPAAH